MKMHYLKIIVALVFINMVFLSCSGESTVDPPELTPVAAVR